MVWWYEWYGWYGCGMGGKRVGTNGPNILQSIHLIPLQLLLFRSFSVLYSREPWSPRYRFHRLYVGSLSAKRIVTISLRSGPKVVRRSAWGHRFGGPYGCQVSISFARTLKGAPTCRLARIGLPRHDVRWARTMVRCPRPSGVARRAPPRAEGPRGGGCAWGWWGCV